MLDKCIYAAAITTTATTTTTYLKLLKAQMKRLYMLK